MRESPPVGNRLRRFLEVLDSLVGRNFWEVEAFEPVSQVAILVVLVLLLRRRIHNLVDEGHGVVGPLRLHSVLSVERVLRLLPFVRKLTIAEVLNCSIVSEGGSVATATALLRRLTLRLSE